MAGKEPDGTDRNITNAPDFRLDAAALTPPPEPPKSLEALPPDIRGRIIQVLEDAALAEYLTEALRGAPTRFDVVRKLIASLKDADDRRKQEVGQALLKLVIPQGIIVSGRVDVGWLLRELQDLGVEAIINLEPHNDDIRLGTEEDITDDAKEGAISMSRGDLEIDQLALQEITPPTLKTFGGEVTFSGTEIMKPRRIATGGEFVWRGGGLKLREARPE